ncbi:glycogen debranching N-terminal domain-containing protein [Hansschlegelia sp.]|uniref:amylo-alpha-1,6-glucosidase n=1 Tax=Hansschlegelia sp. TaxID=2041892 RepID=UPI0039C88FEC
MSGAHATQQAAMDVGMAPGSGLDPWQPIAAPGSVSLEERRPRTLKHGDTFAVFDHNGDAVDAPGCPDGVYHRDTRRLSRLSLTIEGRRPMLLGSTLREDNAALTCDLTNPDLHGPGGEVRLEHDLVHIRRSRFLWNAAVHERIAIRNFGAEPIDLSIELGFAADFADLFEVRGAVRKRRGTLLAPVVGMDDVVLAYLGLDGVRRETRLRFAPRPSELSAAQALFRLTLAPGASESLFLEIGCEPSGARRTPLPRAYLTHMRDARRALRLSASRAASIATSNDIFNEAVRRSVSDLFMLMTDTAEGPYPYAGVPWFSTAFGRDAIITALQVLWLDPSVARGVLLHLAANQATTSEAEADSEPGKILHEVRRGEMAELGEVPFRRYYGSVDSTPLFVMLAGAYLERTGDRATLENLWPAVERALEWIERFGDRDGDGFVEYGRRTSEGLLNQGWKDSQDSVSHEDGRLAEGPIALAEVQAYVYAAWRSAALIAAELGHADAAETAIRRADELRERFDRAFWDEGLGTYALALDGAKRACRVKTSNAGHVLFTGLAFPERAPRVVRTLMARSSFSGWGIRTLAADEKRYNPMSYHNGSVWPHDNALIASGFARYGFRDEAAKLLEGIFGASVYMDLRRLPELFCGFAQQRGRGPTSYPVACSPQAWAAATPLSLVQSCLGLSFRPAAKEIVFERPILPAFLDEIVLRNLRSGEARADVAVRRANGSVVVETLARGGGARIVMVS